MPSCQVNLSNQLRGHQLHKISHLGRSWYRVQMMQRYLRSFIKANCMPSPSWSYTLFSTKFFAIIINFVTRGNDEDRLLLKHFECANLFHMIGCPWKSINKHEENELQNIFYLSLWWLSSWQIAPYVGPVIAAGGWSSSEFDQSAWWCSLYFLLSLIVLWYPELARAWYGLL